MNKDLLKVVIPKKFESSLRKRYNLDNFKSGVNNTPCTLCIEYNEYDCIGCPFFRFKASEPLLLGCAVWQNILVGTYFGRRIANISLYDSEIEVFKKFVRLAEELIEFK